MRTPSTAISSVDASALSPSVATVPLTVTRPSSISSSQVRRLPRPARARTFWSLSLCGGIKGIWAQSLLQRLDDVGARDELTQPRKVVDRPETKSLEEEFRGAVQRCEPRTG